MPVQAGTVIGVRFMSERNQREQWLQDLQKRQKNVPDRTDLHDHAHYDKVVKDLPRIAAGAAGKLKKPWWKFW